MNILFNVCKINRALIMLVNEEKECLEYKHSVGFDGEIPQVVQNYRVPLDRVSNILGRVANTGKAEYIPNVNNSNLRKDNLILAYSKPTSAYVIPLITRSKVIGVIATDAIGEDGVPEETRETLNVFGPQIAIALENAKLYKRLQEQMKALKRSRALLSRAEKFSLLGNIAARLAHEIKNPMTAIGTFIQMIPHKYNDEEFRNDFYKIALEETERVNNLISELLDLVKSKESRFELNDMHGLIEKMTLLLSPQSNAKQIEIVRQFDPNITEVMIDAEKTKQVILNLVSNAIESTHEGGRIEILTKKLDGGSKQGGVCVEVKDNGEGIPESMIDKVFDPYFTTKHKSHMHNGTGLGLFIAYQNMRDHGGTIEVKSRVNEETTFTLTFPPDPASATLST
jgi:signal transduction histidine kinase